MNRWLRLTRTDDPVRDYDRYDTNDPRPVIHTCDICKGDIRGETDGFYGDKYFDFPDALICEDCLEIYIDNRKEGGV